MQVYGRVVRIDYGLPMGWLAAAVGLLLLVFIVRKSVDRETAKAFGLLAKVLLACFALLIIGAIVAAH